MLLFLVLECSSYTESCPTTKTSGGQLFKTPALYQQPQLHILPPSFFYLKHVSSSHPSILLFSIHPSWSIKKKNKNKTKNKNHTQKSLNFFLSPRAMTALPASWLPLFPDTLSLPVLHCIYSSETPSSIWNLLCRPELPQMHDPPASVFPVLLLLWYVTSFQNIIANPLLPRDSQTLHYQKLSKLMWKVTISLGAFDSSILSHLMETAFIHIL